MIEAGRAADVVPLARRAAERVTDGSAHIDDSSGIVGGDLLELTGLYARGCAIEPPDAVKLAAWLVVSRCDGPGSHSAERHDRWAAMAAAVPSRPRSGTYGMTPCRYASTWISRGRERASNGIPFTMMNQARDARGGLLGDRALG
jgi:hypothetical protein